jgi:hypothetical protein
MAAVKKIKKAQEGAGVPKGKVQGEMTGKMYDKKAFMARRDSASADLQKAIGPKKVAPKKKMKAGGKAKSGASMKKCKYGCK